MITPADPVFKVNGITFSSFEDVIMCAWDKFELDFSGDKHLSHMEMLESCNELNAIVNEIENAEAYYESI